MDWPTYRNLSQTMLRVKDGPKSVEFFTKHRGVTLMRQIDFVDSKFSLFTNCAGSISRGMGR